MNGSSHILCGYEPGLEGGAYCLDRIHVTQKHRDLPFVESGSGELMIDKDQRQKRKSQPCEREFEFPDKRTRMEALEKSGWAVRQTRAH